MITFVWRGAVALLILLMLFYTVTITTETEETPLCELLQTTGGTVTLPPPDVYVEGESGPRSE